MENREDFSVDKVLEVSSQKFIFLCFKFKDKHFILGIIFLFLAEATCIPEPFCEVRSKWENCFLF
jgi:hypothetical protein